MNKTKIEWATMTWNPVTGCLHNCPYCYARKIARRFAGGGYGMEGGMFISKYKEGVFTPPYELSEPQLCKTKDKWYRDAPYPFGFAPTFHRYRLNDPQYTKEPQNVFVCSMADLFGEWVPFDWIKRVFEACEKAPQHNYLFLTKNPERYYEVITSYEEGDIEYWGEEDERPTFFMGASVTNNEQLDKAYHSAADWLSIEPLHEEINTEEYWQSEANDSGGYREWARWLWVVIGAETGNRKGKIILERKWIENIVNSCREHNVPVFMKDSLAKIWGEPLIQEYPWETARHYQTLF
jgi:protein gp37